MKNKKRNAVVSIVFSVFFIIIGIALAFDSQKIGWAVAILGALIIITALKTNKQEKARELKEAQQKAAYEAARKIADEQRAEKEKAFMEGLSAIPRVEIVAGSEPAKRRKEKFYPKLTNITARTDIKKLFPLVVVDVETTGLKIAGNDIIEVAAVKYTDPFTPASCFTTLCKPRYPIPAEASEINHITDSMVEDAPAFSVIAASLSEYISGCNIVGHNLEFDTGYLYASGTDLPEKNYYDTCQLARYVLKDMPDYRLETLLSHYDIVRGEAHRALSDAYATGLLFEKIVEDKQAVSI